MSEDQDELSIGAEQIAEKCFNGEVSPDQVYRLPKDGWPIFKLRGKLAARPASIRPKWTAARQRRLNGEGLRDV